MCNPRRVMIHLRRAIEQGWQTTVEQVADVSGEVREQARLTADIGLDAEMGDGALAMIERIMRGEFEEYEPWQQDGDGNFRHDLGDVVLIFVPATRQLMVEAQLTEQISAEAQASAEAAGFTVGNVAVEAVGRYYSDGWGGRTEERARAEAEAEAERKIAAATEALHREQHAAEIAAATAEARELAEQQAAAKLEQRRAEVGEALRERLLVGMAAAQDRVHHTMNRLVGEAYRRSLIQMVQDNGGRVLRDQRSGSVINLELELF